MYRSITFVCGIFILISCGKEAPYENRTVIVNFFPTALGSEWAYELDFSDRGEFRSFEATGLLKATLVDIETSSGQTTYTFSAILDCDWVDRGWAPGSGYVTYFHRIDTTTFSMNDLDGVLLLDAPEPNITIINYFRRMFNWVHPERNHNANFPSVTLEWGPKNRGHGAEVVLSKENGLERFWGDTGGHVIAFKQYTTLTLDLVSHNPG